MFLWVIISQQVTSTEVVHESFHLNILFVDDCCVFVVVFFNENALVNWDCVDKSIEIFSLYFFSWPLYSWSF